MAKINRFIRLLKEVDDSRIPAMIAYPMEEIILIAFLAVLGNASTWNEMEAFGISNLRWLKKILKLIFIISNEKESILMSKDAMSVIDAYNEALIKGDFAAVFETMSDDVKWHQPGNNPLSGMVVGKQSLGEHLGKFAEKSNGTFKVLTNWVFSNDCFVAASVTFVAEQAVEENFWK